MIFENVYMLCNLVREFYKFANLYSSLMCNSIDTSNLSHIFSINTCVLILYFALWLYKGLWISMNTIIGNKLDSSCRTTRIN